MRIILFATAHMEYTIELAESLCKRTELHLFIPRKQADRFQHVMNPAIRLHAFFQPRLRYPSNIFMVIKLLNKFTKLNPDIVHVQGEHPWLDFALPFLKKRYPIVITVHDVILHSGDRDSSKIPNIVYKLNRKCAHQYIVHGQKLKKEMIQVYGKMKSEVNVLPRGINAIYNRYFADCVQDQSSILFFGRIWDYKGLKYLIEAEPMISREIENVKIIIAGYGDNFEKYDKMMIHRERFEVLNEFIANEKVPELFQRSSVVALPYVDASQSGVVPLAYSFKKPVVVTNVGSLPEVVDDGRTGFVVPPRNAKALARAIVRILKDKDLQIEMGESGYRKAKGQLAWDDIAAKTITVYEKAKARKLKRNRQFISGRKQSRR